MRPDWRQVGVSFTPISSVLSPGGEPLVVEKIDDYTMRYVFAAPAATFLVARLAQNGHATTTG